MEDTLKLHTADGVTISFSIAGIGSRSYAFLIDWHIRLLLALAWFLATIQMVPVAWEFLFSDRTGLMHPLVLLVLAPTLLIYLLYHPVLEVLMQGRTPGKKIANLRVVSTTGQTPSAAALIIRNVFRLVDSLPFGYLVGLGVVAATARQVRIGDLAAGTVLVYEERSSALDQQVFGHSRLSRANQEWLQDLLERWPRLDKEARHRLGTKFLERINVQPLSEDLVTDERLYEQLSNLMKESHGAPVS